MRTCSKRVPWGGGALDLLLKLNKNGAECHLEGFGGAMWCINLCQRLKQAKQGMYLVGGVVLGEQGHRVWLNVGGNLI